MELTDTFTRPVVSIHGCSGDIDIHAAGCRDLNNRYRYPEHNQSRHDAGATGEDMVLEWFDNGILDEAVAQRLYTHGGDAEQIRRDIMGDYTFEFTVKPCAVRLVSTRQ